MYVHLGGELIVPVMDVVAVIDTRVVEVSDINREFVDRAHQAKRLRGGELAADAKALVITKSGIIASGVSPPTLARRLRGLRQAAAAWEREK
ncbi:MAG TPA: extracellular matrix/biofilm biosynthesis regulator RemA family protein [bacterium]|nr:extracellular matrix/biofilm biosynthesis regulator RemA family protein [bacterium]